MRLYELTPPAKRFFMKAMGTSSSGNEGATGNRNVKEGLLLRRYHFPPSGQRDQDLSARIEDSGLGYYFPLGTPDPNLAADKARQIYELISKEGWAAANKCFCRELIVAFEWCLQPVLWTYTTIHTLVGTRSIPELDSPPANRNRQRVLVVDSDLRRPTLHKVLHVTNNLGLTNYLLKQNTLEEVIQTTPSLPSLDFLASGKLPSSSLGILSSAQMKDLISELKQRYDFVFFDSPPIMGVSDASILASEVDMTLQVIQYRRYPQPMNIRAKQLIEKVGGNLIGIVLNNINMSQDESYYYYSGYYHDYYSKNDDDEEGGPKANGASEDKPRVDIKPKY